MVYLVDGEWTPWSAWTHCDANCGRGERVRSRGCSQPQNGGHTCDGSDKEVKECFAQTDCPGLTSLILYLNSLNS